MPTSIDLPHGGYRKLIAYRKSETIYQGTVVFCRRFLPARGDRTVDQMVQAARSCKQNIAEKRSTTGSTLRKLPTNSRNAPPTCARRSNAPRARFAAERDGNHEHTH